MGVSSSQGMRLLKGKRDKGKGTRRQLGRSFDPIFRDLPRDGVAMHPEQLGGVADIPFRSLQRAGDEHLLELASCIVVEDSFFEKFLYEPFELVAHGQRSSRPDRRRNASRYFSRVRRTTSSGNEGTGGCLFQLMRSR